MAYFRNGATPLGRYAAAAVMIFMASAVLSAQLIAGSVDLDALDHPPAASAGPTVPGGTVNGHIVCGDSQRPARLAQAVLMSVPSAIVQLPKYDENSDRAQIAAEQKKFTESMDAIKIETSETGVDGSFSIENVPPGEYYVFGSVPGYLQPAAVVQAAIDTGGDPGKPLAGIPTVVVESNRTTTAEVIVSRGASISGKIQWDDQSPVSNAVVQLVTAKDAPKTLPPQFQMLRGIAQLSHSGEMFISPDDHGNYRFFSLAPGEYLIQVMMQMHMHGGSSRGGGINMEETGSRGAPPVIYAPSAFRKADAKTMKIVGSEDVGDVDVTIKLDGLHTVSGHVASAEDHHGLSAGIVSLFEQGEKEFPNHSINLDANGNFAIDFVPSGTYRLEVYEAGDMVPAPERNSEQTYIVRKALARFADGKSTVIVGDSDVTVPEIDLIPAADKPAPAAANSATPNE